MQIWLDRPYLCIKTYFRCEFEVSILKIIVLDHEPALNEPNLPLWGGAIMAWIDLSRHKFIQMPPTTLNLGSDKYFDLQLSIDT